MLNIAYDEDKNKKNIVKHGISFELVRECDWGKAEYKIDDRYSYGEIRYSAMVPLEGRLHNVVFTYRDITIRVISFRKANARERKKYAKDARIH